MTQTSLLDILFSENTQTQTAAVTRPVSKLAPVNRWYYRCRLCLSVFAVEQELAPFNAGRGIYQVGQCGACKGWLDSLGRVERDRLVQDHYRSVCDARCTNASGPNCDCRCGGHNHGSQKVVKVTVDAGGIPQCQVSSSAKAKAESFEAQCETWENEWSRVYGRVSEAKGAGRWVARFDDYLKGCAMRRAFYKASGMATYSLRQKKIQAMIDTLRHSEVIPA